MKDYEEKAGFKVGGHARSSLLSQRKLMEAEAEAKAKAKTKTKTQPKTMKSEENKKKRKKRKKRPANQKRKDNKYKDDQVKLKVKVQRSANEASVAKEEDRAQTVSASQEPGSSMCVDSTDSDLDAKASK